MNSSIDIIIITYIVGYESKKTVFFIVYTLGVIISTFCTIYHLYSITIVVYSGSV